MTMENVRTCDRKMYKRPIIKITDGKLEYEIWKKASEKKKMDERELFMIDPYITDVFVDI